ncbi:sulfite exporter TauE/SafE family protein [Novosphingobium sp. 9]|uniref:sulfite exporter TauE/SafE family protein n=1 Tax=Novosphingobium sp. 9 TaxID=2025349 RepID=UPI00391F97A8
MELVSQWGMPVLMLLAAGVAAGFVAGLFGIGGGFVVVPVLFVMLPLLGAAKSEIAHVAIGTSLATIIISALRATHAQAKRGAVDFEMLKTWAPWIVIGDGVGVWLASRVSSNGLAMIFGVGVALMAVHFLHPVLREKRVSDTLPVGYARVGIAGGLGAFSSLLGIGGGTIAIIVQTLCGRDIHRSIATASGIGVIIAIPGTIGFMIIGLGSQGLPVGSIGYINLLSVVAISATSIISAPWGVAAAHKIPKHILTPVFGLYLLFVAFTMIRHGLGY